MRKKRRVVIGLLGPVLDAGTNQNRWRRWRPSVALVQHEALPIDRFELLVDDKFAALRDQVMTDIGETTPRTKVRSHNLATKDPWDFVEVYGALYDFARAYDFRPDEEEYLIHITTGTHVAQICLFLLTEAGYFPAKLLQTSPPPKREQPDDVSPPGAFQIVDLDLSKYDQLASRFERDLTDHKRLLKSGIATQNDAFNRLIDRIERVAIGSRAPILLTGPTGAGKSQLARQVYELKKSRRQVEGPFVEVNCATLRGDGAMSALFGHTKGSFTGATTDRPGLLRSADGGLLFLDEIGELGLDEQAMLLRAVEEKRFLPVGSDKDVRSDFQLIAGTNRDLSADVACGRFREDLLARINLWTFRLPALRDRREDIEPNLDYELDQFARRDGRNVSFSKEARARFLAFATSEQAIWTGNFRDLNAAITRMATLAVGGRITEDGVDEEIDRLTRQWAGLRGGREERPPAAPDDCDHLLSAHVPHGIDDIDRFDRVQLAEVIRVCRSARSLSEAGRTLFASSRGKKSSTNDADRLGKYLARFGIDWRTLK